MKERGRRGDKKTKKKKMREEIKRSREIFGTMVKGVCEEEEEEDGTGGGEGDDRELSEEER